MTNREIARTLVDSGFTLFKRGSKHDLYKTGEHITPVPHGTGTNPRAAKSLRSLLRRVEREQPLTAGRYV